MYASIMVGNLTESQVSYEKILLFIIEFKMCSN